jgi:hypothetical protein
MAPKRAQSVRIRSSEPVACADDERCDRQWQRSCPLHWRPARSLPVLTTWDTNSWSELTPTSLTFKMKRIAQRERLGAACEASSPQETHRRQWARRIRNLSYRARARIPAQANNSLMGYTIDSTCGPATRYWIKPFWTQHELLKRLALSGRNSVLYY